MKERFINWFDSRPEETKSLLGFVAFLIYWPFLLIYLIALIIPRLIRAVIGLLVGKENDKDST